MAVIDLAEYKYSLSLDSSKYDSAMTNAGAQAETMKSKLSGVGSFMKTALVGGLAAAGVAIAGTIASGVKATADLNEQVSKFQATTGATAEDTEKIKNLSKELFKTNTDSMEDIVATATEMKKSMGLSVDEIEKYQQKYMDYAKTTGQSNTDVVTAIDHIGDAWGLTAEESAKSLDMLKASNEKFGTDIASVQSALTQVAPASKALGLSLEETNGYMNLFATSGLDANQSITAFTYASKQVKSPEEFKKMLSDISAITDPTERAQAAVELFGSKAGVAMANVPTDQLNDFMLSMNDTSGTVSKASAEFDNNFNVQLELMKKQFSGLSIEIGEKFMPIINSILSWVTEHMPQIVATIESAIDTIGLVLNPFIEIIKNVISSFQDTETQTSTSFGVIKEFISSTFSSIQEIINVFVTLFKTIWEKWGTDIVAFAKQQFDNIKNTVEIALKLIKTIITTFTALLNGDWKGFFSGLKDIANNGWNLIKSLFKTMLDSISGILNGFLTVFKTIGKNLLNALWEGIKAIWEKITTWFTDSFNGLIKWFGGFKDSFKTIGKNILNSVFDGLKSTWESISTWVSDKVSWLTDKLTFWKSSKSEMADTSTTSASGINSYDVGSPFITHDQVALIHKGEAVLRADQNPWNPANFNKMNASQFSASDTVVTNGVDYDKMTNSFVKALNLLNPAVLLNNEKVGEFIIDTVNKEVLA